MVDATALMALVTALTVTMTTTMTMTMTMSLGSQLPCYSNIPAILTSWSSLHSCDFCDFFIPVIPRSLCRTPAFCSVTCGTGVKLRDITCTDHQGAPVDESQCDRKLRPLYREECNQNPCYASSCAELKKVSEVTRDDDYNIYVNGGFIKVYCHNMDSSDPKEYITLPAGDSENYSEIYQKRLNHPLTCPYNGTRYVGCNCAKELNPHGGLSTFRKIRFNITTFTVITHSGGEQCIPVAPSHQWGYGQSRGTNQMALNSVVTGSGNSLQAVYAVGQQSPN
ncbi:PREDICTED: A disintegrin and metalloproteinase with thrombospondin motifs 9-like [Priapulus caudatus]|uniref:A disintegrin and metalloproteinase with thrombospondin motifs 9-like n=1 Tax=Priapulus caudatus TaxID=37621 RepID=A0ABM1EUL0_PRICU|nr:PREDICTED: A disintegrin and metalloproteinase with thrombospondin motifs 9-like [Priapulus caudatus]